MYVCRLFRRDHPFEQVEARVLVDGQITIGRDPAADWPLGDTDPTLSRIHCTLAVEDGRLLLRDSSTNGTFLGEGQRAPRDASVVLQERESLHLGALTILIEAGSGVVSADTPPASRHLPTSTSASAAPSDWCDDAAPPRHRDASLLEAFCQGAKLDASALSAEDPAELMHRIGAVYQQTVLGLATLMAERARLKAEHHLERTTIGASDNNLFKWAPTRRLAQDLLAGGDSGFLSAADAVRASFNDISNHLAAVTSGANAATDVVLATLSPQAIETEAGDQGFSLRGRAAVCWDVHNRRHADLIQAAGKPDSATARAFAEAYGKAAEVDSL